MRRTASSDDGSSSTGRSSVGDWRLKVRIWRVSSAARRAASRMPVRSGRRRVSEPARRTATSASPRMAASMLLKSWATPGGEPAHGLHLLGLREVGLELDLSGHVALEGHVADEAPALVLPDRRDARVLDEEPAVLPPVRESPFPRLPRADHGPHLGVEGAVLEAALQQARVLAHRLGRGVAGDALEGGVHVEDGSLEVGEDHGLRRLVHRGREASELALRLVPRGDVPRHGEKAPERAAALAQQGEADLVPPAGAVLADRLELERQRAGGGRLLDLGSHRLRGSRARARTTRG